MRKKYFVPRASMALLWATGRLLEKLRQESPGNDDENIYLFVLVKGRFAEVSKHQGYTF